MIYLVVYLNCIHSPHAVYKMDLTLRKFSFLLKEKLEQGQLEISDWDGETLPHLGRSSCSSTTDLTPDSTPHLSPANTPQWDFIFILSTGTDIRCSSGTVLHVGDIMVNKVNAGIEENVNLMYPQILLDT